MGLTAALTGILSVQFVNRTKLGFFDTDCMIVFFSMAATWCFFEFGFDKKRTRYFWFVGGMVVYGLFLWWWHMAIQVVTIICMFPLMTALAFFYRPPKKEGLIFASCLVAGFLLFLTSAGWEYPVVFAKDFFKLLGFVAGADAGLFPNASGDISELQKPPLAEIIGLTTANMLVFLLACIGLGTFIYEKRKESLFLATPLMLACFTFLFGNRFLIFFAPVIALGLGYLVKRIELLLASKVPYPKLILVALVLLSIWPAWRRDTVALAGPIVINTLAGIKQARASVPEDAVLWSSWNVGYPLMYYASLRVIGDGQSLEGERMVYANLPLASTDQQLSANFIQYYVKHGMKGLNRFYKQTDGPDKGLPLLKKVLAAGPEQGQKIVEMALESGEIQPSLELSHIHEWMAFFYPRDNPPIYIMLHKEMTKSSRWFWYGKWDPVTQSSSEAIYKPFFSLSAKGDRIQDASGLDFKREKGGRFNVTVEGKTGSYQLTHLLEHTGLKVETLDYKLDQTRAAQGLRFEWVRTAGYGAMMSPDLAESVFNRLFIRHSASPAYFRHKKLGMPSYQLWQVLGDAKAE